MLKPRRLHDPGEVDPASLSDELFNGAEQAFVNGCGNQNTLLVLLRKKICAGKYASSFVKAVSRP